MRNQNYVQNTGSIIRTLVDDSLRGEFQCLKGMVDYLVEDRGYSTDRIVRFATRTLHIPEDTVASVLADEGVTSWN